MADEKFSVTNVKAKMSNIENYFSDFADTLNEINAFIQGNVNASISSSVYGDLGSKLLAIWNHNASTFNDFHENFDNWAQVVAIIAANNNTFAVDALATYRDNAGTLDGVKEAREFISGNNGVENISSAEGFGTLSTEARSVLDYIYRAKTRQVTDKNEYDGKTISYTDAAGNKIEIYYDEDHNLIGRKVTDTEGKVTYYEGKDKKVDKLITGEEYKDQKKKKEEEARKALEEQEKKEEETKLGNTQASSFYELGDRAYNGDQAAIAEWIEKVGKIVQDTNTYGMKKSLIIAQIINESGWISTHASKLSDYNNILGINTDMGRITPDMQDSTWSKRRTSGETTVTQWNESGTAVIPSNEDMRYYSSIEECIEDYANVLYLYHPECKGNNNLEAYRSFLESYTPNPNASTTDKYAGIISKYNLERFDV